MMSQANGLQAYFTTLVLFWVGWRCGAATCDEAEHQVPAHA